MLSHPMMVTHAWLPLYFQDEVWYWWSPPLTCSRLITCTRVPTVSQPPWLEVTAVTDQMLVP